MNANEFSVHTVDKTATCWLRRDTYISAVDGGCKLANSHGGFTLSGPNAYNTLITLAPHLSGTLTRGDLEAALGMHGWAVVSPILDALTHAGMLRWISAADRAALSAEEARKLTQQIAFLSQYIDTPHAALAAFTSTRFSIPGTSFLSDSIATNLGENGACHITRTETDADVIIYDSIPDSAVKNAFVVTQFETSLWALPFPWTNSSPKWQSALSILPEPKKIDAAEPVQRLFGALVAYEIFKGITGAIPPETDSGALVIDIHSGETRRHRFIDLEQLEISHQGFPIPSSYHSEAEQFDQWEPLTESELLPVRRFTDLDLEQIPFKVTLLETPKGTIFSSSPWTTADARIEAIRRAFEAQIIGEHDGAGVALISEGEGHAADRAARNAIEAFLRTQKQLHGTSCPAPQGAVGTFTVKVSRFPITWIDLGIFGAWHAGMAVNDQRWQIAVGNDLNEALCRAGSDLVASYQIMEWRDDQRIPQIVNEGKPTSLIPEVHLLQSVGLAKAGLIGAVATLNRSEML